MRHSATVAVILAGLVSGCGAKTKTVYQPYAGVTPQMSVEQALDICDYISGAAKEQARAQYEAAHPPPSSGGFAAGFARGLARGTAGN